MKTSYYLRLFLAVMGSAFLGGSVWAANVKFETNWTQFVIHMNNQNLLGSPPVVSGNSSFILSPIQVCDPGLCFTVGTAPDNTVQPSVQVEFGTTNCQPIVGTSAIQINLAESNGAIIIPSPVMSNVGFADSGGCGTITSVVGAGGGTYDIYTSGL